MIVELCGKDLLALVNDQAVLIGDHIVRPGPESKVIDANESSHRVARKFAERDAEEIRERRSNARGRVTGKPKQPKKTGKVWMRAIFNGYCNQRDCDHYIHRGDLLFRNHDTGMNFCEAHGDSAVPVPDELRDLVSTTRRR